MCTAFRDGFQSVYGARVFTKDFLPAVEAARDAGISYFEAGGGARFQSLYFYCNEDAFDMMDAFREAAGPDANLQTLARGVNVVGLESQPSDIVNLHAVLFKKHGMTTIRNFDALNDVNNLIYSGKCIVEAGLKHQVCVTLMELPPGCEGAHDAEFYTKTLKEILAAEIPFDAVCFKGRIGDGRSVEGLRDHQGGSQTVARRDFHPLPHARNGRRQCAGQQGRPRCGCRRDRPVDGSVFGRHLPAGHPGNVARAPRQ